MLTRRHASVITRPGSRGRSPVRRLAEQASPASASSYAPPSATLLLARVLNSPDVNASFRELRVVIASLIKTSARIDGLNRQSTATSPEHRRSEMTEPGYQTTPTSDPFENAPLDTTPDTGAYYGDSDGNYYIQDPATGDLTPVDASQIPDFSDVHPISDLNAQDLVGDTIDDSPTPLTPTSPTTTPTSPTTPPTVTDDSTTPSPTPTPTTTPMTPTTSTTPIATHRTPTPTPNRAPTTPSTPVAIPSTPVAAIPTTPVAIPSAPTTPTTMNRDWGD